MLCRAPGKAVQAAAGTSGIGDTRGCIPGVRASAQPHRAPGSPAFAGKGGRENVPGLKKGRIQHCDQDAGRVGVIFGPGGSPRCADYRDARGPADRARKRAGIAWGRGHCFCIHQCFGRACGCDSVGFLGMLIRGCRGSPGWWGGALAPPAAQVCPGAVLPLLAPHLQKESPSTARKSRGEGSGEGRHRAILCTTGTDGKRLMR